MRIRIRNNFKSTHLFYLLSLFALLGCEQRPLTVKKAPASRRSLPQVTLPHETLPNLRDEYRWLESLQSPRVDAWVKTQNDRTFLALQQDHRFDGIKTELLKAATANDRLTYPALRWGWIYNYWADATHRKGLWRRSKPDLYEQGKPQWESLLDIDELSRKEGRNWVWQGATCLPHSERCLIQLSDGGEDAFEAREFDLSQRAFVTDGFHLPRSKGGVNWLDKDHLLVNSDFGPGTLTKSGYPRIVKLWERGTPLSKARTVLEGHPEDFSVGAGVDLASNKKAPLVYLMRNPSFFESRVYLWAKNKLQPLPFPASANFQGSFGDNLFVLLRDDWKTKQGTFHAGSLLALPIDRAASPDAENFVEPVFSPNSKQSLQSLVTTKSALYLTLLDNVSGRVLSLTQDANHDWKATALPLPLHGNVSVLASDNDDDHLWLSYTDYLTPNSIQVYNPTNKGLVKKVQASPPRFNASGMVTDQWEATSKDGTKIPYFIVHPSGQKLDGSTPTVLYGYGGFASSMTPSYLGSTGKLLLERGGAYVVANIRGGGEFGPAWHRAAMGVHRQKAYDDFIAVAEDLIRRKVTSSRHLGIWGGSNGGLLVGAVMVERPDLFNAVLCEKPLLDMIHYRDFPPGDSWTGEYGDPTDPVFRNAILKYSPYQNVSRNARYPRAFFVTSRKDDRVHPSHARKMAARMLGYGKDILFYESVAGGHATSADLNQAVSDGAMKYVYFFQQLFD